MKQETMKRGAPEDTPWPWDAFIATVPDNTRPVFAVVCSPFRKGLFKSHEDVKKVKGHLKGGVYVKWPDKPSAAAWFEASLRLPVFGNAVLQEVHVSARCYDITQDRDWEAAVAIYFGPHNPRNMCLQARGGGLEVPIFQRALDLMSSAAPARIICDCKRIVYGINYGLWEWPRHTVLSAPPEPDAQALYDQVKERNIELQWRDDGNVARAMVTRCCEDQYGGKIKNFRRKHYAQFMITYYHCLVKSGLVMKDVAKFMVKVIQHHPLSYQCVSKDIMW